MRNPSLDVLRAAAVLLVFCYHSEGALLIARFGWIGVDLFFVLSGFLVAGLLFREYQNTQQVKAGRFLLRRGLKIYPQFYSFIGLMAAVSYMQGNAPPFRQILAELLFIQNYAPGLWTHTWSLGVEEHFYLLLTLVIVILAGKAGVDPFRSLPLWIAGCCGTILLARVLTWRLYPAITDMAHVFPSHLRIDSLLTGVCVAYFHAYHPTEVAVLMRRFGGWVPPLSIGLLAPVSFLTREDPFMVTAGFSLVSGAFGLLLLSVLYPPKPAPPLKGGGRAMAWLGQHSYAFYLWHGPVIGAGDSLKLYAEARGTSVSMLTMLIPTFAASVLMAVITTRLIEIPALRWRDRNVPAGTGNRTRPLDAPSILAQTS